MKANKSKIIMFFVALVVMVMIVFLAVAISNAQTGYLYVIDYANGDTKGHKTKDIEVVNKSFENHFKQPYDLAKELRDNIYFESRNNHIRFYVEKKRIITTRKGKEKYRKIKRTRRNKFITK